MLKIIIINLFFLIIFSREVLSFSSSSYLIANSATYNGDYDVASKRYDELKHSFTENPYELKKQLVAFVNINDFKKAYTVALKITNKYLSDQESWIIRLAYATFTNNNKEFEIFKLVKDQENLKVVEYIFYSNNKRVKDKILISEKVYALVQSQDGTNNIYFDNHYFLLFYLNLALFLNESHYESMFIKAQVYQHIGKNVEAEKILNNIDVSHNLYLDAQKSIALLKNNIGKSNESIKIIKKLLILYPNDLAINVFLADIYRFNKKYEKSIKILSKIINQDIFTNDLWKIYYKRAISYERSKDWENAEKDLIKSLDLNPGNPQVLNYLAYGWIEQNKNLAKSLKMLEEAAIKNPDSHYILDSLGWAYYKQKKLSKAADILEKVLDMAPGEAISIDHLGDIYFALGRKREGFYMWKQALDLATDEDEIKEKLQIKIEKYNEG